MCDRLLNLKVHHILSILVGPWQGAQHNDYLIHVYHHIKLSQVIDDFDDSSKRVMKDPPSMSIDMSKG